MENETDFDTDTDSLLFDQTEEDYPRGMDDCPPDEYDGYEEYEDLYEFEPMGHPGEFNDN
jgi:hypothetical protein